MHQSAQTFLDLLGLPSEHPYLDSDQYTTNQHGSRSFNVDHHEWSLFDYFFPSQTGSVSSGHATPHRSGAATLEIPSSHHDEDQPSGFSTNASPASFGYYDRGHDSFPEESARPAVELGSRFDHSASSAASHLLHAWRQVIPCILSTFHLCFLRLFCPLLWVSGVAYLLAQPLIEGVICSGSGGGKRNPCTKKKSRQCIYKSLNVAASLTALLTAMTMMTDRMYCLEYSQPPLVGLFVFTSAIVAYRSPSRKQGAVVLLPILAASVAIWTLCDIDLPYDTNPQLKPGFYFDSSNPVSSAIVNGWDESFRTYDEKGRDTPWLVTGDTRTGVPFIVNHLPEQKLVRRWLPTNIPGEKEAVILDFAFPSDGVHRGDRPIYLILHGLNGGSNEGYVRDFVARRRAEGSTVAILVTRGLMDSPILGANIVLFPRTSDVASAARALRKAAGPGQTVAGVGYSMGAIVLANYVARSGQGCDLDAAVSLSGALDTRVQLDFKHSTRFWQPFLAKTLRETMTGKFMDQIRGRLTPEQVIEVEEAASIVDLDRSLFVRYHGFNDIIHYYSELGAMGDWVSFDGGANNAGRISNVTVPLLTVNSLDDPIGDPRCIRDPAKVAKTGMGYVFVLLTKKGGHVGWPLGMNPSTEGWRWMSDVASSFVESVNRVRHAQSMTST